MADEKTEQKKQTVLSKTIVPMLIKNLDDSLFPGYVCTQDIFSYILDLLKKGTLIQIISVNKAWHSIAIVRVFKAYNAEIPHPVKGAYLLNQIYQDFKNSSDLFSDQLNYSKALLQRFMLDCLDEVIEGNENVLEYTQGMSQLFIQNSHSNYPEERNVGDAYINIQLLDFSTQLTFLLDKENINCFMASYDVEKGELNKNIENNYLFVIQYFNAAKKIESFVTTLVLFNKIQHLDVFEEWNPLKNQQWTRLLMGDGLVALCTRKKMTALRHRLINASLGCDSFNSFTIQEARNLLSKFRSSDILKLSLFFSSTDIIKAINVKQPEIFTLLCSETRASDEIMLYLLDHDFKDFFEVLNTTPELAKRLRNPIFLNRFFALELDIITKKWLAIEIFKRSAWVADLLNLPTEFLFKLAKIALYDTYETINALIFNFQIFAKFSFEQLSELHEIAQKSNKYELGQYLLDRKLQIKRESDRKNQPKIQTSSMSSNLSNNKYNNANISSPLPSFSENKQTPNDQSFVEENKKLAISNIQQVPKQDISKQHGEPKNIKVPIPQKYPVKNQCAITSSKKPFEWPSWLIIGLLILAGLSALMSFLGLLEVPFAVTVFEKFAEVFGHCTPQTAALIIFVGSVVLGFITFISLLIRDSFIRGTAEYSSANDTENYETDGGMEWSITNKSQHQKQMGLDSEQAERDPSYGQLPISIPKNAQAGSTINYSNTVPLASSFSTLTS